MKELIDKSWRSVSEFGSVFFFVFLIVFLGILNYGVYFSLIFKLSGALIISYIVSLSIRAIYFKDRPKKQKYKSFIEKLDASSFPSMHTMRIVIIFVLFTMFFKRVEVFAIFLALSIIVATSRSITKKHYWTDIIVGYVLGIIIGYSTFIFL